jgi:pimeloyl-ACP methyl ester carboxylesterase
MELPQTRYAKSGDVSIAWQKFGAGPRRIVFAPGFISHAELIWEQPRAAYFLQRLGRMAEVVIFDKRGTGMSDRVADMPTLDQRMDDIAAVMDAAGFDSASLIGISEGGAMCQLFAATHPRRVEALVLMGSYGSFREWVLTGPAFDAFLESIDKHWGEGRSVANLAPSLQNDAAFLAWWAKYERSSASPGAVKALMKMNHEIDVLPVLSSIAVPTLILHRTGDRRVNVEAARYMARTIPGARLIEYPGIDHMVFAGDPDAELDDIEEFLTGARPQAEIERVLATVMFTDIVDSTRQASAAGDKHWTARRQAHDQALRTSIAHQRGRIVKAMGDGFLAVFDGPARGVRAGQAASASARQLGLPIRVGLHTGEIALEADNDISGIAVAIAARVSALAGADEVLVSSTVRDLVAGSGLKFRERGLEMLKGIDEPMRIFAAES